MAKSAERPLGRSAFPFLAEWKICRDLRRHATKTRGAQSSKSFLNLSQFQYKGIAFFVFCDII